MPSHVPACPSSALESHVEGRDTPLGWATAISGPPHGPQASDGGAEILQDGGPGVWGLRLHVSGTERLPWAPAPRSQHRESGLRGSRACGRAAGLRSFGDGGPGVWGSGYTCRGGPEAPWAPAPPRSLRRREGGLRGTGPAGRGGRPWPGVRAGRGPSTTGASQLPHRFALSATAGSSRSRTEQAQKQLHQREIFLFSDLPW